MDVSKAPLQLAPHCYTGAVVRERVLSGAAITRVMHPPGQRIAPHGHDWPVLAIYRVGAYREADGGRDELAIDGPGALFTPAGEHHANHIGAAGLETVSLSFDPAWLLPEARALLPSRSTWFGGQPAAREARAIMRLAVSGADEHALRASASEFLTSAIANAETARRPRWLDSITDAIERDDASTRALAAELSRHPAWITRAYRAWRGEGVLETLRRRRVERAMQRLRTTDDAIADIALASGFCDQSHMNRVFRAVLGRTPRAVRAEAPMLAGLTA